MEKGQVIFRLFVPTDEQAAKAVHPRMRPFHDPTPRFEARFSLDGFGLRSSWANMGGKTEFAQDVTHLVIVIALVQAHALRLLLGRLWTSTTILPMVGRTSFISWRLAPSIVRPMGSPCPSESLLRLTPLLPRSVGLGPVFSHPTGLWSS